MEVHTQARPLAKSRLDLIEGHQRHGQRGCWQQDTHTWRGHRKRVKAAVRWVESSKYHAYCRRAAAEVAPTSTSVMLVSVCVPSVMAKFPGNFKSAVKKDNTLGQPNPVQKFGKKGQDGAVQNCCPFFGDPKVTF